MALVTVQRSPSSSNSSSSNISEVGDETDDTCKRVRHQRLQRSFSQSFVAIKGAALILPQGDENVERPATKRTVVGDLQTHLQSMFMLLRPQDTVKLAVRLESIHQNRIRYLVVVSCIGRQDTQESVLLGVDYKDKATIGLVLPIWRDTTINLDGDGGFTISSNEKIHIFKPVSVQALWSALQCLNKNADVARMNNYFSGGLHLTWTCYYESKIRSEQSCINEWNEMLDIESRRKEAPSNIAELTSEREITERLIRAKLREVMMKVDLDNTTSKQVRLLMEEEMGISLTKYKWFVDEEIIIILRQMDSASKIFDHVYLGSEWNASNLEELKQNGIGFILNLTREIDNFYPGTFEYKNIRVYDNEETDLLKYWDDTYKFMDKARELGSKVLVHCKMGVSRSAATVIAYAMKEYGWSLKKTFQHVKDRRNCINPNSAFMNQLEEYEGILGASKQRHNKLWRSKSETDLEGDKQSVEGEIPPSCPAGLLTTDDIREMMMSPRPKSWSPDDAATQQLIESMDEYHTSTPMDQEEDDDGSEGPTPDLDDVEQPDSGATARPEENLDTDWGQDSESKNLELSGTQDSTDQSIMIVVTPTEESPCESILNTVSVSETLHESDLENRTVEDTELTSGEVAGDCTDSLDKAESTKPNIAISEQPAEMPHCGSSDADDCQKDTEVSIEKAETEPVKELIKVEVQGTDSAGNFISEVAVIEKSSGACVKREVTCEALENEGGTEISKEVEGDEEQGETGSNEENIDTYTKESIPWNPGTVQRHKQELEERLKSELSKAETSRTGRESRDSSGVSSRSSSPTSPQSSTEDLSTGELVESGQEVDKTLCQEEAETMETEKQDEDASEEEGERDTVPEPGTVKRTMEIFHKQIEKEAKEASRDRVSSWEKDTHSDDSSRSSRASSIDDVRPTGKTEDASRQSDGEVVWENDDELSDRSDGEVKEEEGTTQKDGSEEKKEHKFVVIAGEEMQYEPGYVKRFTLDFEQMFAEVVHKAKKPIPLEDETDDAPVGDTIKDSPSGDGKENACSLSEFTGVGGILKEPSKEGEVSQTEDETSNKQTDETSDDAEVKAQATTESSEQDTSESNCTVKSSYKEEMIELPVGTVKQQREAIEGKTSKDASQLKKSEEEHHEWVKEGKLTVEEVRKIRDLGKLILGKEDEHKVKKQRKSKDSGGGACQKGMTQSCSDENLPKLAGIPTNSVKEKAMQLELTGTFSQPELKRSASVAKMSDELVTPEDPFPPEFPQPDQGHEDEGLRLLRDSQSGGGQQDSTVKGLVGIFNRNSVNLDSERKESAGSSRSAVSEDDNQGGEVSPSSQVKIIDQRPSDSDGANSEPKQGSAQSTAPDGGSGGTSVASSTSANIGPSASAGTSVGSTACGCSARGMSRSESASPTEALFLKPKDQGEEEASGLTSRKVRTQHGKTHPLSKLNTQRSANQYYNTM
ncbi:protein phosphatase Slingshot homolog 1-like isoform X2 [Ptychodera flava]|uniref:protein phosphatase Slingshot homolog 1-like isoform X2 n=1 Tax=Ptychodera flava TaxID=63121 RepID=UPI003969CFDD